jgi:hypothetical protein
VDTAGTGRKGCVGYMERLRAILPIIAIKGDRACTKAVGVERPQTTLCAGPTVGDVQVDRCQGQNLFT